MGEKKIKGLGGWLIFLQITLWASLVISLITLIFYSLSIALYISTILSLILLIIDFIFLYKKKEAFILFSVILLWISLFSNIIITFFSFQEIISFVILTIYFFEDICWTIYLLKSRRVKNTFIN